MYDGPGRSISSRLSREARVVGDRELDHRGAILGGADRRPGLCGGRPAGTNRTRSRPERLAGPSAIARWPTWNGSNVPPRMPSEPGTTGAGAAARARPSPTSQGSRLPLELDRADPDRSPAPTPARRSSPSIPSRARSRWNRSADSSTSKFVCAASRSIRRPRTRNAPSASRSTMKPSPGGSMRWTTTPAGSGGATELGGVRQQLRDARRAARRGPSPVVAEIATTPAGRRGSRASRNAGQAPRPRRQVDLVEHDEHRLLEERRVVRLELVADDAVVPVRVAIRAVDDVDEDPRPLDVAQEGVAEARALARALDQARDVGDRRPPLVVSSPRSSTPEVRLERRERVVGDLRRAAVSAASSVDLPAFGSPTSPTSAISRSSRRSQRSSPGSPFWACLGAWWVAVSKWTLPRPPRPPRATIATCPTRDEVGEQLAGGVVVDRRARRDGQGQVVAGLAVAARARPAAAGRRLEVVLVAEVAERRLAGVDAQVDRAAAAAVAAVRTAARHVRLAPERRRAVAAVAGADADLHAVEEHRRRSSHSPGRKPAAPVGMGRRRRRDPARDRSSGLTR